MLFTVILFCVVICVSSITGQEVSCGIAGQSTGFIFNGKPTEQGRWPWIVSIHKVKDDSFKCGGTLIGLNMVLTVSNSCP